MAVTAVLTRAHKTETVSTVMEYGTAALTGTYATGGFTFNSGTIKAPIGGSPTGGTPIAAQFFSPLGYIYAATFSGNTGTVKIFSAPGTELANTTAVPDASVTFIVTKKKASS